MKKILCVLLSITVFFSSLVAGFAIEDVDVDGKTDIPVIVVSGDGSSIVNKDGEKVLQYKNLLSEENRDEFINSITSGLKELIKPLIVEGLLTDNWDNFYDTLYDVISDIFKETLLDKNGEVPTDPENPAYGSDIDGYYYWKNWDNTHKYYEENHQFDAESLIFYYDWRLDPFVTV